MKNAINRNNQEEMRIYIQNTIPMEQGVYKWWSGLIPRTFYLVHPFKTKEKDRKRQSNKMADKVKYRTSQTTVCLEHVCNKWFTFFLHFYAFWFQQDQGHESFNQPQYIHLESNFRCFNIVAWFAYSYGLIPLRTCVMAIYIYVQAVCDQMTW